MDDDKAIQRERVQADAVFRLSLDGLAPAWQARRWWLALRHLKDLESEIFRQLAVEADHRAGTVQHHI